MTSFSNVPPAVAELLEPLPAPTRALTLAVRDLVFRVLRDVVEIPDTKARVLGYGYGAGYKHAVATIILSRSGVKLGLISGASLADPTGLLAGTGKVHRHIQFSQLSDVDRPAVKALLLGSFDLWRERTKRRDVSLR